MDDCADDRSERHATLDDLARARRVRRAPGAVTRGPGSDRSRGASAPAECSAVPIGAKASRARAGPRGAELAGSTIGTDRRAPIDDRVDRHRDTATILPAPAACGSPQQRTVHERAESGLSGDPRATAIRQRCAMIDSFPPIDRLTMTTTPPGSPVRLVLPTAFIAVVAVVVATIALLRPPAPAATPSSAELEALRQEVAELRRSVELTRSQFSAPGSSLALADAEQRLAKIEARLAATPDVVGSPANAADASPPRTSAPPAGPLPPGIAYDAQGRLVVPTP